MHFGIAVTTNVTFILEKTKLKSLSSLEANVAQTLTTRISTGQFTRDLKLFNVTYLNAVVVPPSSRVQVGKEKVIHAITYSPTKKPTLAPTKFGWKLPKPNPYNRKANNTLIEVFLIFVIVMMSLSILWIVYRGAVELNSVPNRAQFTRLTGIQV